MCRSVCDIPSDETWFHFYAVPNKESNKTWVKSGENQLQITRTAQNAKKRMFCDFCSIKGVVARIVVPKGQTVNGTFIEQIKTIRNVVMHHDNVASYKSKIVTEYLEEEKAILLPHLPYSLDLAPCDFFLFLRIKEELKNKHFDHIENLACAVQAITDGITKEDYQNHLKIVKIGYKNA
ncbi:1090_t:CDS:2 [Entrophospora sp. SA101]|nr:1090_t:CDS:2 [Entrophospora sp. SA101]